MRQRTFSSWPLSRRTFFPQNHTGVISGGEEHAPLHPLAGESKVARFRSGGVLPREGRLIEGGEADLRRMSRPHRVLELRPAARRARRRVGRDERTGTPTLETYGVLTKDP